jgi:hypothetical protein
MKIPFNFGKEIKKMLIDEEVENNKEEQSSNNSEDGYSKFIKDVNKSTIGFSSKEVDQEYSYSHYGYEYKTIVPAEKESGPILGVRVELHIHKEKLDIIEKIVRLKYGTSSHTFLQYITDALVKSDSNRSTITRNNSSRLLQKLVTKMDE